MERDWQFTNPFFEEGYIAASSNANSVKCPYNYLVFDTDEDIIKEMYRQIEWYAGFRSYANKVLKED